MGMRILIWLRASILGFGFFFGSTVAQIGEICSSTSLSSLFTITMAQDGSRRSYGHVSTSINWQKIYARQIHDIYIVRIKKRIALLIILIRIQFERDSVGATC